MGNDFQLFWPAVNVALFFCGVVLSYWLSVRFVFWVKRHVRC